MSKRGEPEGEMVKVPLPVSVQVEVTPEALVEVLQSSKLYKDTFKPRMDVGRFIADNVSKDFFAVFYEKLTRGELDWGQFLKLLDSYHAEKEITGH